VVPEPPFEQFANDRLIFNDQEFTGLWRHGVQVPATSSGRRILGIRKRKPLTSVQG
jgi:hypothetical protein